VHVISNKNVAIVEQLAEDKDIEGKCERKRINVAG
jgi:hypothetical protein